MNEIFIEKFDKLRVNKNLLILYISIVFTIFQNIQSKFIQQ
jgi:hypothetical protein